MGKVSGQIFTNAEVEKTYGEVEHSQIIQTSVLKSAVRECDEYVFFNIQGGNTIVAKSMNHFVHPRKFHYVSKSVLQDFLDKHATNEHTELQTWTKDYTFAIKNGNYSIQGTRPCPPFCP